MGGVLDWSTTPGSNTTVDGVNIAEGMQAGLVNNGMRAIMALVREWQLDASGVVTAGAGDAYTITSNQGIAAYADGLRFSFRADRNNTGAATLNVDGHGAKALRKTAAGALTALAADDIVAEAVYDVVYDVSSDVFVIVGTHGVAGLTAFGQSLVSAADAAAGRVVLDAQQLDADLTALAGLASTGMIARTGSGTVSARTITAGTGISVANGDGVSGNPTISSSEAFSSTIATTSGTSVNLSTTVPAGVRRIDIILDAVSLSGADFLGVQIGSGSFAASGYVATGGTGGSWSTSTAMFPLNVSSANGHTLTGHITLIRPTGNQWMLTGMTNQQGGTWVNMAAGQVTLGGALDRVRLIAGGANTFDGGQATIGWSF